MAERKGSSSESGFIHQFISAAMLQASQNNAKTNMQKIHFIENT
jgi:hypothetical protein